MCNLFKYIWQLPQNLIGLFIYLLNTDNIREGEYNNIKYFLIKRGTFKCGVSLGNYIFLYDGYPVDEKTVKHEYGHHKQSVYLGPLYLIVVGIASAIFNNLWDRVFHKKWSAEKRYKWYYSRYPEKWADKLGKVNRFV